MKRLITVVILIGMMVSVPLAKALADEMDVLVNKLVEKGVLTPYEGQILAADAKEEAAKELAQGIAVTAPKWTQKITMKGDVRFRTQTDWGKGLGPAHQRTRQRVRARLGIEGKVNDQVKAGVLAVTGGNDPRSTNQTLDDNFETQDFRLDAYYIKWQPKLDSLFSQDIGDMTVWLGKYNNPYRKTELLWDSDICPGGMSINYMSPNFEVGEIAMNAYFNTGMLWIDEIARSQRDPLLWPIQGGLKMDIVKDWDAIFDFTGTYWSFGNIQHNPNFRINTPVGGSMTNDFNPLTNEYDVDFNVIDFMISYDAKRIFDYEIGNGVFADLIYNSIPESHKVAWMIGGYIGHKKPKKPNEWKLWGNWRYISRNAVPDFLPDSDFYGFDYTARFGGVPGAPAAGGTNGQGWNVGFQYAVFKNTVLALEYYYMWPIQVNQASHWYEQPYQLLQFDIKVKF